MKRHGSLGLFPLLCLLTVTTIPPAAVAQEQNAPSAAKLVTDYLRRDIFLRPGVGLKKVKIGTAFRQVREAWGPPTSKSRIDLLSNKWTYEVANHTTITLVGDNTVEEMRIAGGFNSPYVTTEGAAFGMARHQLASIYGPTDAKSRTVRYDNRGIGFLLDHGQVSEMQVFAPE